MTLIATFTPDEYKTAVCFWQGELFSNFVDCANSPIIINGRPFRWSEQIFMLIKTIYFYNKGILSDKQYSKFLSELFNADSPMDTKKVGRSLPLTDADLAEWNDISRDAMYYANWYKYQNNERRAQLEATNGRRLVEASPYDKIWGVGFKVQDFRRGNCQGENRLGSVLEELRSVNKDIILPRYQKSFAVFDDFIKMIK